MTITQLLQTTGTAVYPNVLPQLLDQTTCPICHEDFAGGDMLRSLACLHIFHDECFNRWFAEHTNCPVCRQEPATDSINGPPVIAAPGPLGDTLEQVQLQQLQDIASASAPSVPEPVPAPAPAPAPTSTPLRTLAPTPTRTRKLVVGAVCQRRRHRVVGLMATGHDTEAPVTRLGRR